MTESTVGWFIVREKYCSLAEKVRLISQVNRAMLQVSLPTTQWTFSAANRQREPLQEYYRKFMHLRAHTPNITDEVVILTAVNSHALAPAPQGSQESQQWLSQNYTRSWKNTTELTLTLEWNLRHKDPKLDLHRGRSRDRCTLAARQWMSTPKTAHLHQTKSNSNHKDLRNPHQP